MAHAFIIVGNSGAPLYELLDLAGTRREDVARSAQFLLHAALDCVDLAMWSSSATYLKVVERHNDQLVSAYVTPGGARFLVLHEVRSDDGVRAFCNEAHEVRETRGLALPRRSPAPLGRCASRRPRPHPNLTRLFAPHAPPAFPSALHQGAAQPLLLAGQPPRVAGL